MKTLKFTILFILVSVSIYAQKQSSYFQQEVNYTIKVSLDDQEHMLNGDITMEYKNQSPDNLSFIWMHIWPNAYADNNTALGKEKLKDNPFYTKLEKQQTRGYIDSMVFQVNGKKVDWAYHPEHHDICKIYLNEPLAPGNKIEIKTPFRVKIPDGSISRLGHSGQTYAITQWYPKPAVYDQYGWHEMPYLDMGEFYSEFGKFDVYITVPKNYRVAATGNLHNETEIAWLDSLAALNPDSTDLDTVFPSSEETKTLHFSEKNIHDFGWFTAKNYHVQKNKATLASGKQVNTWTFYSDRSKRAWAKSTTYINDALYYYSKWNGDYPYKNCTALEGPLSAGGGMEYPTITVIGHYGDTLTLEEVIMHEVGHNWFYGFLASDERIYPFMDEGINSANEQRYMKVKYPNQTLAHLMPKPLLVKFTEFDEVPYYRFKELQYLINEKRNYDQKINLPAYEYTSMNYGTIVYAKAAHIFNHLRQYLGDEKYDSIYNDYYNNHVFTHVYPDDLEKTMNSATNKNLDWFFTDWLTTRKRSDYALKKAKNGKVLVKNSGKVNSPFLIQAVKDTQTVASLWVDGFEDKQWIDLETNDFEKVYIDKNATTYDFDRHNNYLKNKGAFKKVEPLKLKLLSGLDHDFKTEIFYLPYINYTVNGGLMPGIVIHNRSVIQKMVEYEFIPKYSIGAKSFMGTFKLDFFFPMNNSYIRNIRVNNIMFQKPGINDKHIRKAASSINLEIFESLTNNHEFEIYTTNTLASDIEDIVDDNEVTSGYNYYNNSGVTYRNTSTRIPWDANIDLETRLRNINSPSKTYNKLTFDANFKFMIKAKKSIDISINSRTFLHHNNGPNDPYYLHYLSGTFGVADYKYDYEFIDRFRGASNISGNQLVSEGGGFGVWTAQGVSNTWMNTLNVNFNLIPVVSPYMNLAHYDYYSTQRVALEAGLRIGFKNIFEFYLPLYFTSNSGIQELNVYDNYSNQIRFTLNLEKINVFKLRSNIPY